MNKKITTNIDFFCRTQQIFDIFSAELKLGPANRRTLSALISSSGNRSQFETSYFSLATHFYPEQQLKNQFTKQQKPYFRNAVARYLRNLNKFQENIGFEIFRYTPGSRTKENGTVRTKIELNILDFFLKIYKEACSLPDYFRNPLKAISDTVRSYTKKIKEKARELGLLKGFRKKSRSLESKNAPLVLRQEQRDSERIIPELKDKDLTEQIQSATTMVNSLSHTCLSTFDLTVYHDKKIYLHKKSLSLSDTISLIPAALTLSHTHSLNVSLRPRISNDKLTLIHLDDLNQKNLNLILPFSAVSYKTSYDCYQACVIVEGLEAGDRGDFQRQLKTFLGADLGANGSLKLAGSLNAKHHRFTNPPEVSLIDCSGYGVVSTHDLLGIGFVFAPDTSLDTDKPANLSHHWGLRFNFKSSSLLSKIKSIYDKHVKRVPKKSDGITPDYSLADFIFCSELIHSGFFLEDVADVLKMFRPKAKNRPEYATRVVQSAAKKMGLI